jgi:hypothetical protein
MHWYSKNRFIPIYKTSPFYRQQKEWEEKRHKKQEKDQIPNPIKRNPRKEIKQQNYQRVINISKRVWFVHHYTSTFVSLPPSKEDWNKTGSKGREKRSAVFFPLLYQPP